MVSWQTLCKMAKSSATPGFILGFLSNSSSEFVRSDVAINPNTTEKTLIKLSEDRFRWVRENVAKHPKTPKDILATLSKDKEGSVRSNVARNVNTAPEILSNFKYDKDISVIEGIIFNPSTPKNIVINLGGNANEWQQVITREKERIAGYENISQELLRRLGEDKSASVRSIVAWNKTAPEDLLLKLSKDHTRQVREAVAESPNTPELILSGMNIEKRDSNYCKNINKNTTVVELEHDTSSPEYFYNYGVSLYVEGDFEKSIEAFDKCYKSGLYQTLSVYAIALCQKALDVEITLPEEFEDKMDTLGSIFIASNLVCKLINDGYKAALTGESSVLAVVDGSKYDIRVVTFLGSFMLNAWRKEQGNNIPLSDSSYNPNPTSADDFVISIVQEAPSLPPYSLPDGGLPSSIEL